MTKTQALLVLVILGLLAVVLGVGALHWWDQGLDIGLGPAGGQEPGQDTMPAARRLTGGTDPAATNTATDREQVIQSRSGKLRPAQLLFRCETLRNNVAGVWHHMQLRVRVEGEAGQHLAECKKPWLPWTVSIPEDVHRIALVARGYKRTLVPAPPPFHKGVQPTVVVLEPDALVRVRAINLPWTPDNRFLVSARLATGVDKEGKPLLFAHAHRGGKGSEAVRGEITAEVKVPSGLPAMFVVRRTDNAPAETDGFMSLDSEVVTLKPLEEREILIDLRSFGVLEGRVTGLARPALKDQVLRLRPAIQKGRVNFPDLRMATDTMVRLDAEGNFRISGLSKRRFTLKLLADGGAWPSLKEVGSDRSEWSLEEVGFLVVEPAVPVHGVVPVKQGVPLDRPFKVQANTPPNNGRLAKRIPLFTRALLEKAPLFFFVEGIGYFDRSLAGKLPDPDGLYRVEVPVPGGSLVVHVENQPGQGTHLFARPLALTEKHPWISITGRRAGDDWRFEGLASGDYKLVVNYTARRGQIGVHSGRILPDTIAVKSGTETRVSIRIPDLLEINGVVANWQEIPAALTPRWLQLSHGGRPHTARLDKDGNFKLTVMGPWEGVSEITFLSYGGMLGDLRTTDITWLPAEKRLSVMFPRGIRERRVSASPVAGGRLWMHVYLAGNTDTMRRSPRRHGQHISPRKGNVFLMADDPGGVDGILLEQVNNGGQNTRLLRGWFRLRPGGPEDVQIDPKGRFVQVATTADGQATLTLKPPTWWQHPAYPWAALRLQGATPQPFWIPDDATAVVVNGQQEIPTSAIGEKLVVD